MKQEFQHAIEPVIWRSNNIQLIINNKCRLICQLCIIVWWQVRQWMHLVDESWTARRGVVRWRQPTTWTRPVQLTC